MKIWIFIIIALGGRACKPPQVTQPTIAHPTEDLQRTAKSSKKEEKKNIDSLFIVYSLPIYVSQYKNFKQVEIKDALIALLKEKKYKCLDTAEFEILFKSKLMEILPKNDLDGINTRISKLQNDKDYLIRLIEDADPFAQQIQLSYLNNDSTSTYINVKRANLPNSRKLREWTFNYQSVESFGQLASRILDSLTNN